MRKILIIAGILLCCLNMQAQDMKSFVCCFARFSFAVADRGQQSRFRRFPCQQYEGSGEKPFWKHVGNVEADR